jgi:hypothetical protein
MTPKSISFLMRLEGVWIGEGKGSFPPRVPEFKYIEELTIKQGAKPSIFEFRSATRRSETGEPMHVEVGFIRCIPESSSIELVASHPFGLCEVSHGSMLDSNILELRSAEEGLVRTQSAKGARTTRLSRVYELDPVSSSLTFTVDMATDGHPSIQNHLVCIMRRRN